MQNINDVEYFYEMIQSKEKLKAAENHQKKKKKIRIKKKLGLDPNVVICDEQDIASALQVAFE